MACNAGCGPEGMFRSFTIDEMLENERRPFGGPYFCKEVSSEAGALLRFIIWSLYAGLGSFVRGQMYFCRKHSSRPIR